MPVSNIVPDDSMDVVPQSESVRARARQVAAAHAADADECALFLAMLGLDDEPGPDPGTCRVCGKALSPLQTRKTVHKRGCCSQSCASQLPPLQS